ncbi:MAG TPA: hypothetical protein VKE71_16625, partial [Candidatus Angelobacter sp.]|nr:hypothetical protein [Candidatus Angelobacter sp.]
MEFRVEAVNLTSPDAPEFQPKRAAASNLPGFPLRQHPSIHFIIPGVRGLADKDVALELLARSKAFGTQ